MRQVLGSDRGSIEGCRGVTATFCWPSPVPAMNLKLSRTLSRDSLAISGQPAPSTAGASGKNGKKTSKGVAAAGEEGIPPSGALTGIELRIQNLLVVDNGTAWIWPFIRYSDLYVIIISVDNLGGDPYRVTLEGYADIDDGESLSLDRTAYLWQSSKNSPTAPNQIHLSVCVVKSRAGLRKFGAALAKLKASDDYKSIVSSIAKAAATSGASAIADGVVALTGLVGSILSDVEDVPLFTSVSSFTGINGDFDSLGRHIHQKGNKNISLEVALTVRDANRDKSNPPQG